MKEKTTDEKEKEFWLKIKKEGEASLDNYKNLVLFQEAVLEAVNKRISTWKK